MSKPGIDVGDRHEAAEQQHRSGRDGDGERDFRNHQAGAGAAAKRAADGAAAGILQARLRIDARRAQRRQDTHEDARQHRRQSGARAARAS